MKTLVGLLVGVMIAGCTPASEPEVAAPSGPSPSASTPAPISEETKREIAIYAAVVRRLVRRDHTFGRGTSPFDRVYIVDGPLARAGSPGRNGRVTPRRPFRPDVRRGLTAALEELPPVRFVSDPRHVRNPRLEGAKGDGVIITLGPIARTGPRVEVATGLWCGGLCGQWMTYVLKRVDERWMITGTTGPYIIS